MFVFYLEVTGGQEWYGRRGSRLNNMAEQGGEGGESVVSDLSGMEYVPVSKSPYHKNCTSSDEEDNDDNAQAIKGA